MIVNTLKLKTLLTRMWNRIVDQQKQINELRIELHGLKEKQRRVHTNAVGQVRETDGSMDELAFVDGLYTTPDLHRDLVNLEKKILGPKKQRRYDDSGTEKT